MFEEYPFAKSSYRYLLDFLALLTPERHKEIAEMLFPKYMLIDGKDFIFNKNITRRKYTWYSNEVYGVYEFSNESNSTKDIFKEIIGNDIPHLMAVIKFVELLEYINTLSSSDVEKIKKLVDVSGTIYPLLEIYFSEYVYVISLVGKMKIQKVLCFIRAYPNKEINYNWFHFDIIQQAWASMVRHNLHLPIAGVFDKVISGTSEHKWNNVVAYKLTMDYYLNEKGKIDPKIFYEVRKDPLDDTSNNQVLDDHAIAMVMGSLQVLV